MATTKRNGLPEFWSTHIAKVLSGDQPCYLAPWLTGHYKIEKRHRDQASLAVWKSNHSEQLKATVDRYRGLGWKCTVEQYFRVTGQSAVLSGKADLICQQTEKRPLIVDVKSGEPRDSDVIQVMIEQIAIPLAWGAPVMQFDGEVVYQTHSVEISPHEAAEMKPKVFGLLKRLGTMPRPEASPSQGTCRFCDVSEADCPDRWDDGVAPAVAQTVDLF